jgi:hypothetical protein
MKSNPSVGDKRFALTRPSIKMQLHDTQKQLHDTQEQLRVAQERLQVADDDFGQLLFHVGVLFCRKKC